MGGALGWNPGIRMQDKKDPRHKSKIQHTKQKPRNQKSRYKLKGSKKPKKIQHPNKKSNISEMMTNIQNIQDAKGDPTPQKQNPRFQKKKKVKIQDTTDPRPQKRSNIEEQNPRF